MHMSFDPVQNAHDHAMVVHWAQAVGVDPSKLFLELSYPDNNDNVLRWGNANNVWFTPDYEADGVTIIDNERLEHFRLAFMHDCLSNLMDVAINLDDDPTPDLRALFRLTHNDPDYEGNQSWITRGNPDSLVYRTLRLSHIPHPDERPTITL